MWGKATLKTDLMIQTWIWLCIASASTVQAMHPDLFCLPGLGHRGEKHLLRLYTAISMSMSMYEALGSVLSVLPHICPRL